MKSSRPSPLFWILLSVFITITALAGYYSYNAGLTFGRDNPFALAGNEPEPASPDFVPSDTDTQSSDTTGNASTPSDTETASPTQAPNNPGFSIAQWQGVERVNVLVMGLDLRDWEEEKEAPRTDTMILFTLDPVSRKAGMISIPRDLWVPIPGFEGYQRINTAYRFGELYELPGGGPALASQTVEQVLGTEIDYYAQVDFGAFVRMIDILDGVKLDIPEEIVVDPIGPDNKKTIKPGIQVLPGDLALAYARARNSEGGDFDRAQRQQQVILGIRQRVLEFDLVPILLSRADELYAELSAGVTTNMTLQEALQLALLAIEIPIESIQRGVIGSEQVTFVQTPDGDQVLKPLSDKIRELRDQVFSADSILSGEAQQATELERVQAEAPTLAIYNGTTADGLARRTAEYLVAQGILVESANIGPAPEAYPFSLVVDHTGNPYTMQYLVEFLRIQPNRIRIEYNPNAAFDVEIFLGADWAGSNPLP